jgi:hypothetical protein
MLLKKPMAALATIRNKYSHKYVSSLLNYKKKQYDFKSYFVENGMLKTDIEVILLLWVKG